MQDNSADDTSAHANTPIDSPFYLTGAPSRAQRRRKPGSRKIINSNDIERRRAKAKMARQSRKKNR